MMSSGRTPARGVPGSRTGAASPSSVTMLHTPTPDRLVETEDEERLPPAAGILIAMAASVVMWGAIYAAFALSF